VSKKPSAGPAFLVPPTERIHYKKLNPAPYNPRRMSREMIQSLKQGILLYGLVDNLVVQKTGLVIIGGHQRYRAVKELAIESGGEVPDLPCVVLDIDDRSAKRLNIALNRIGGEWDEKKLGELLADIHSESPITEEDVVILGYDDRVEVLILAGVYAGLSVDDGTEPGRTTGSPSLKLDFPTAVLRDEVKAMISAATKKDEASGVALARLLGAPRPRATRKKRPE
jgi:ParB-like chromosome segregation protein Spo0J